MTEEHYYYLKNYIENDQLHHSISTLLTQSNGWIRLKALNIIKTLFE